jgi:hypothetical protein
MMENRYQWLSPLGGMRSEQERCPSGQFKNQTLLLNDSVLRAPVAGMTHYLPLSGNYKNSFWIAGKACADLIMLYREMDCRMA